MKTSEQGINLVKQFEGLRLDAYLDVVGIPTIGYGHTGPEVEIGQSITLEQATELLRADLADFEECVNDNCHVELDQNEFDSLVCLSYNIGCKAFRNSTLLRMLNSGDRDGAAEQFLRWDKAGGKQVAGLTRRRHAERDLFLA